MKTAHVWFAALLVCQLHAKAQDHGNHPLMGIKAGINYSTLQSADFPSGYSNGWLTGPVGGLFGNLPIGKRLAIRAEGLYGFMGGWIDRGSGSIEQCNQYLSAPVMLTYHASRKLKLMGGAEWDVLLKGKSKDKTTGAVTHNRHDWRGDDIALTGGIEFWPTGKFLIGARYIHGLLDLHSTLPGYRNRTLQGYLGLGFGRKIAPATAPVPAIPMVTDRDNDGVPDTEDKCPELAGLPKYKGCPIPDTDQDGIDDEKDLCPTVPGLQKYKGCPIPDTDGDGVDDETDKCPSEKGLARYGGCPIPDTDGDGVNDEEDKCLTIPGIRELAGCPKIDFNAADVQFLSGSATLTSGARNALNKLAAILNDDFRDVRIRIEGHTDNTGNASANQTLSEKRAVAVKNYLAGKKVDAARMDAIGYGQTQPVAENDTPEGRLRNRRVVFRVTE